jgi:hypothetical protein
LRAPLFGLIQERANEPRRADFILYMLEEDTTLGTYKSLFAVGSHDTVFDVVLPLSWAS